MTTAHDGVGLDNPFWSFSLDRYGRDGVAPLCLQMQREFDADVNLLLFGLWLGLEKHLLLEVDKAEGILRHISDWRDQVVRPLRKARTQMKSLTSLDMIAQNSLREAIKTAELRAEQIEQAMLFDYFQKRLCGAPHAPEKSVGVIMLSNAQALTTTSAKAMPLLQKIVDLSH
jgi:uncharacterized protein (TIGR02444 family)